MHACACVCMPSLQTLIACRQADPPPSVSTTITLLAPFEQAAGATDTLASPELKATILAPTNAAFSALLKELGLTAQQALDPENKDLITAVRPALLLHCLHCSLCSATCALPCALPRAQMQGINPAAPAARLPPSHLLNTADSFVPYHPGRGRHRRRPEGQPEAAHSQQGRDRHCACSRRCGGWWQPPWHAQARSADRQPTQPASPPSSPHTQVDKSRSGVSFVPSLKDAPKAKVIKARITTQLLLLPTACLAALLSMSGCACKAVLWSAPDRRLPSLRPFACPAGRHPRLRRRHPRHRQGAFSQLCSACCCPACSRDAASKRLHAQSPPLQHHPCQPRRHHIHPTLQVLLPASALEAAGATAGASAGATAGTANGAAAANGGAAAAGGKAAADSKPATTTKAAASANSKSD